MVIAVNMFSACQRCGKQNRASNSVLSDVTASNLEQLSSATRKHHSAARRLASFTKRVSSFETKDKYVFLEKSKDKIFKEQSEQDQMSHCHT